jgi:transposase
MEACGGANYWARQAQSHGHEVRLIAPQFVKPFVKSNKTDAADAAAISEAAQRPDMRFVSVKTIEQQDLQSLHRMRSLAVQQRTAHVNQIRGLLLEYGIVIPQGRAHVRKYLPDLIGSANNGLTPVFRELLSIMYDELVNLDERIETFGKRIEQAARNDIRAQWLMSIPGVGPLVATALISAIGDVHHFRNGRELAAWIGLAPRQHSTGGKPRLLGISKRGNVYLRTLLIHGARSAQRWAARTPNPTNQWVLRLEYRRCKNIAAVALAHKIVRIAYALLNKHEFYQVAPTSHAA